MENSRGLLRFRIGDGMSKDGTSRRKSVARRDPLRPPLTKGGGATRAARGRIARDEHVWSILGNYRVFDWRRDEQVWRRRGGIIARRSRCSSAFPGGARERE